jgi:hypothetical protein
MFTTRKITALAIIVGAVALAVALTGCASDGEHLASVPAPTVTITVTATPEPVVPTTTATEDSGTLVSLDPGTVATSLAYLNSSERSAAYDAVFARATNRIASALLSGELGETYSYNDYKVDKPAGYSGWGGISTVHSRADGIDVAAWVYWKADGSVDFSQGVKSLVIDAGFQYKWVHIESEAHAEWALWNPVLSKLNGSKLPLQIINISGWKGPLASYETLSDVDAIKQLDAATLDALNVNMVALFGADW